MRAFLPLFRVLIPISVVVVAIMTGDRQTKEGGRTREFSPATSSAARNHLRQQTQWREYLNHTPKLARYRKTLLRISERLPFESFSSLTPELQQRLAAFAESRLNPELIPATICWEPGVPMEVISAFHLVEEMANERQPPTASATQFSDDNRWGRNATFRSILEPTEQGLPTTLTWSFIPDGTSIFGFNEEPTSDSDLIAFLDARYGVTNDGSDLTTRPWFSVFQAAFDNIASLTGITYVYEPNDDGAALTQSNLPSGRLGRRGDVRIGGHFVDGEPGANTLAYNFFPSAGDMIIDTGDTSFFGDLSSNSLNLRNVVEHEHGHGLGLSHVCPVNQTKLMEPFISRRFRGLQLDDIFSLNRLYGDFYEKQNSSRNNDSTGNASLLEVSTGDLFRKEFLSIDDNNDVDFYRIDNIPADAFVTCRVIPVETPPGFVEGPQNSSGSCSSGNPFDFSNVHNLSLDLLAADGSTILDSASGQPVGQNEEILAYKTRYTGTVYLKVDGDSTNSAQLYTLEIAIENLTPFEVWAREQALPKLSASAGDDPDQDGILNVQEYYFGLSPLVPQFSEPISSALSPDGSRYLFSFNRDPNAQPGEVFFQISENLVNWSNFAPTPDEISIVPRDSMQSVTIEIPATGAGRYIRIAITPSN